jgi:hypothetical protein
LARVLAEDLDQQHPGVEDRLQQGEDDAGHEPVEAAAGSRDQRRAGDQERQARGLGQDEGQ